MENEAVLGVNRRDFFQGSQYEGRVSTQLKEKFIMCFQGATSPQLLFSNATSRGKQR